MKKLAYLFVFVCIIGLGYFVYDTYRIINAAEKDEADVLGESVVVEDVPSTSVHLKYQRYSLDHDLPYSLVKENEDGQRLYLYENAVNCDDREAFEVSNPDLYLVLNLPDDSNNKSAVTETSIVNHDVVGNNYEISSVPTVSNAISYEKVDGKLKGDVTLEWVDRSVAGEFEADFCK